MIAMYSWPSALRRGRHLFNRILSVARRRVHLKVAFHVLQLNQLRQRTVFGSRNFARVLAQFRWNVIQLQLRVNLFFGLAGNVFFALQRGQLILVERVSHVVCTPSQRHVVLLRAGEI